MKKIIEQVWLDDNYWQEEVIKIVNRDYNKSYTDYEEVKKDFSVKILNLSETMGDLYGDVWIDETAGAINIKAILEAQKKLDRAILERAGIKEYPVREVRVAYLVELGEALQEWKEFKYWKQSKGNKDNVKLLDELADCLHFASSLENNLALVPVRDILELSDFKDIVNGNLSVYELVDECSKVSRTVIIDTIGLALAMGYTLKQLEEAYYKKNKVNWERINNNY